MVTAPSPNVLLDLAERCERATGPDRELDYEIAAAVNLWLAEQAYSRVPGDNGWYSETPFIKGANKVAPSSDYTASIDAAMTLVPEGLHWVLKSSDPKAVARIGGWKTGNYRIIGADAATRTLALCAAALRARSTDVQGE